MYLHHNVQYDKMNYLKKIFLQLLYSLFLQTVSLPQITVFYFKWGFSYHFLYFVNIFLSTEYITFMNYGTFCIFIFDELLQISYKIPSLSNG